MMRFRIAGFTLAAAMSFAAAGEAPPVVRGKAGLAEVPFRADNAGAGTMTCAVSLAHWYSADLGAAAPGESVRATLWSDPRDGSMLLLNGLDDHMPVETLWCGAGPRAWANRAVIGLKREAGETPAPIHVTCRAAADTLACR